MRIRNIFENSFNINSKPQPKWAFDVFIDIDPEEMEEEDRNLITQSIAKVEIPQRQMLMVQSMYKGLTFDIPTRQDNGGTATLTFNEATDLRVRELIREYIFTKSFNPNGYIIDEWSQTDDDGNYKNKFMLWYSPFNIYVKLYNENMESDNKTGFNYCYILKNCYFESIGEAELNYDGNDEEGVTWTCQVHYNGLIEGADAEAVFEKIKIDKELENAETFDELEHLEMLDFDDDLNWPRVEALVSEATIDGKPTPGNECIGYTADNNPASELEDLDLDEVTTPTQAPEPQRNIDSPEQKPKDSPE